MIKIITELLCTELLFSYLLIARRRLGIRVMCPSGATCLSADCCSSEHYKNPAKHVDLVQSGPHHQLIEN
jgi:hypothetical protein